MHFQQSHTLSLTFVFSYLAAPLLANWHLRAVLIPCTGTVLAGLLVTWYTSSTDRFVWFPKSFFPSQIKYVFKYASPDCASPKRKFHSWAVADLARLCFKTTLKTGHWVIVHRQRLTRINFVFKTEGFPHSSQHSTWHSQSKHFDFFLVPYTVIHKRSFRRQFRRPACLELSPEGWWPVKGTFPALTWEPIQTFCQTFGIYCSAVLHNSFLCSSLADQRLIKALQAVVKQMGKNCNSDIWQGNILVISCFTVRYI